MRRVGVASAVAKHSPRYFQIADSVIRFDSVGDLLDSFFTPLKHLELPEDVLSSSKHSIVVTTNAGGLCNTNSPRYKLASRSVLLGKRCIRS
jgi:hypothetical protein